MSYTEEKEKFVADSREGHAKFENAQIAKVLDALKAEIDAVQQNLDDHEATASGSAHPA